MPSALTLWRAVIRPITGTLRVVVVEVMTVFWLSKQKPTRLPSNLRQDHLRMPAFGYASSLPVVTKWRLHHSIRRTRKLHTARKHHGMFDRTGFTADRSFYIVRIGIFDLLAP